MRDFLQPLLLDPTGIEITPEHHADILRRLAMMKGEDEGLFAPRPTQAPLL